VAQFEHKIQDATTFMGTPNKCDYEYSASASASVKMSPLYCILLLISWYLSEQWPA